MLQVSELYIYPVKSLGGIALSLSLVTDRGLQYDRRWMLVNEYSQFISQRECPQMALLGVEMADNGLKVYHKKEHISLLIPFEGEGETITVKVWSDLCKAQLLHKEVNEWFSDLLSVKCRLVYMPDRTQRRVDFRYAANNEITSFADAFPFLLIGQSSLDDLNNRLTERIPVNRFRPNIVFTGGEPYEEDVWAYFAINDLHFYGVKPCARCVVTTIDQENAITGKEPLKTLAAYRNLNNKIYFGQNLIHKGQGVIRLGDTIEVNTRKAPRIFEIHS